jgi:hypothetical protein
MNRATARVKKLVSNKSGKLKKKDEWIVFNMVMNIFLLTT